MVQPAKLRDARKLVVGQVELLQLRHHFKALHTGQLVLLETKPHHAWVTLELFTGRNRIVL